MKKRLFTACFLAFLLSAFQCNKTATVDFLIENKSNGWVRVEFFDSSKSFDLSAGASQSVSLFSFSTGMSSRSLFADLGDSLDLGLRSIRLDSLDFRRTFSKSSNWVYEDLPDETQLGEARLFLFEEDF